MADAEDKSLKYDEYLEKTHIAQTFLEITEHTIAMAEVRASVLGAINGIILFAVLNFDNANPKLYEIVCGALAIIMAMLSLLFSLRAMFPARNSTLFGGRVLAKDEMWLSLGPVGSLDFSDALKYFEEFDHRDLMVSTFRAAHSRSQKARRKFTSLLYASWLTYLGMFALLVVYGGQVINPLLQAAVPQ